MTTLTFEINFHGPFIVSDGLPSAGLDHRINRDSPLPNTQIRGLLRAHALNFLCVQKDLVDTIFGSARHESPWVFSDAQILEEMPCGEPQDVDPSVWNRVHVDEDGRAEEGAMVTGEQVWASHGTFSVEWEGPGEPPVTHVQVLRAAARDIVSLGLNRRRGFGWVSITDELGWTEDDSRELVKLVSPATSEMGTPSDPESRSDDEH